ncbi:hypothetical protein MYO4S_00240 [Serratia phage 4S]|nr:hypothetical protein MYO4S_00240 [Serratia phage 4S]
MSKKYFDFKVVTLIEPTNEKEAEEAIAQLLSMGDTAERHAESLADKFKVEFSTGDYGSGRTYYPAGTEQKGAWGLDNYYGSFDAEGFNTEGYWVSSSDQC